MQLPDHLSSSQITKFMMCPLSYRFHYVDQIETGLKSSGLVLGSAFHAAAETLHKHLMNGGVRKPKVYQDVLGDSLSLDFGNFNVQCKNGESQDSLTQDGVRLVDVYLAYRTTQKTKIVAAEHKVQRELVNVETGEVFRLPFVAYLDLIEKTDEGLAVVDLKTAARSYSQGDVDLSLQLTAYGLLVLLETGDPPAEIRIDAVIRSKEAKVQRLATRRSAADYVWFFGLAQTVRKAIESGHFYPNPGWQCAGCEFKDHCRTWCDPRKEEDAE